MSSHLEVSPGPRVFRDGLVRYRPHDDARAGPVAGDHLGHDGLVGLQELVVEDVL